MKRILFISKILFFIILLVGCNYLESHPYDVHITGKTNINAKNIAKITKNCKGKKTIRFVMMGDSQRFFDETRDFVNDINKRDDIDFVIHGGDISDFGLTKEFMEQRDLLNKLKAPYVVIIGNHDYLGTGEETFEKVFGKENYSFIAGNTKFLCLNTNALDNDYSKPIPDFSFIENELKNNNQDYEQTVFAMHVPPYSNIFNNNVAIFFESYVKHFKNTLFCTNAHEHCLKIRDIFNDGITYFGCDTIGHRSYILFTIHDNHTYEYEIIKF